MNIWLMQSIERSGIRRWALEQRDASLSGRLATCQRRQELFTVPTLSSSALPLLYPSVCRALFGRFFFFAFNVASASFGCCNHAFVPKMSSVPSSERKAKRLSGRRRRREPLNFLPERHVRCGFGEDAGWLVSAYSSGRVRVSRSLITNDITSQCRYVCDRQRESANTKSVVMKSFVNEWREIRFLKAGGATMTKKGLCPDAVRVPAKWKKENWKAGKENEPRASYA